MTVDTIEEYSTTAQIQSDSQTPKISKSTWIVPEPDCETLTCAEKDNSASIIREQLSSRGQSKALSVPSPIHDDQIPINLPDYRIKLLQQWECVVIEVQPDCVACEMHDLTDDSQPEEYAEVYLTEFSLFDRPLLQEGAVFYWSIGHEIKKTGNVRKYSELRVRRMPPLSKSKEREITKRAEHLKKLFGTHDCKPTP